MLQNLLQSSEIESLASPSVPFIRQSEAAAVEMESASGSSSESEGDDAQDFFESTSEGDEIDAHLLERVLEGAYSSRVCPSSLDPAQRDSILFYDKDLCGDMEDELGEYT